MQTFWLVEVKLCSPINFFFFFDLIIIDKIIYFVECCIISIMLNSVYSPWLILSYLCHENLIYVLPYIALHAKGLVG
ncbi:hypothetical protein BY996DRAFT_7131660 [Phakopsora pachyrhizi]|uniref:Expressed protein n=1 Tax=Phakopsora pachyrhizi TaxID=170000 RepID=A0AAV0AJB3_PHAPC|nr:hypothetical protein BY996DRAFT_7586542 [Phakopsora pachyrhizi]KAI8453860.1 hypothetical protein BY996DRAFT_7131660 [Phakopsora pachyrhizi]CAH7666828.1 expressed protein [Phakopsora pachyrhizi]CAH7674360.1 expressed protein [Phakopsora pachyrhizi]CAH7687902.1 expressed protein [Phakopsora pachyrhizi]